MSLYISLVNFIAIAKPYYGRVSNQEIGSREVIDGVFRFGRMEYGEKFGYW